jgi:hypothetical protein
MPRGVSRYDEAQFQRRLWSPSLVQSTIWLDASDLSTISTVSGGVSELRDKSGNNRHVVQATAGSRPTFTQYGINNLPVITFAAGNLLSTASNFPLTGNATFSVFCVCRKTNAANGNIFGWGSTVVTLGAWGYYDDGTVAGIAHGSNNTYFLNVLTLNKWNLISITKSAGAINTNTKPFLDGLDSSGPGVNSTNTPNITSLPLVIGRWANNATPTFGGDFAEFLVVPSSVSLEVRQTIEGYLAWKWGLQTSLIANHPYINRPPLI